MHFTPRTIFAVVLAALIGCAGLAAAPKDGDFASGWNTWKDSAKGDWAEYAMQAGATTFTVRYEVTKVSGDQITMVRTNSPGTDKEIVSKPRTRKWNKHKMQAKLPRGKVPKWADLKTTVDGKEIDCQSATWSWGDGRAAGVPTSIWFSTAVPCGGVVKTTTGGKAIVWLTKYHKAKKKAKPDPVEPKETPKSDLPAFYAKVGNFCVHSVSRGGVVVAHVRTEVTKVTKTGAEYTIRAGCAADGSGGKLVKTITLTKKAWDKDHAKPSETGVKVKVKAGEFVCDVFKRNEKKTETTEWVCKGVVIKAEIVRSGKTSIKECVKLALK